jgi:hypothetical protein
MSTRRPSGSDGGDTDDGEFSQPAVDARILLTELHDVDLGPDERFVFHLSHVVYGPTLGACYGSNAE